MLAFASLPRIISAVLQQRGAVAGPVAITYHITMTHGAKE
jgi:hypothetical protein